jgi:hypothetical protein
VLDEALAEFFVERSLGWKVHCASSSSCLFAI